MKWLSKLLAGKWCMAFIIGASVGGAFSWWWTTKPEALEGIVWLDVMTAFGTVGAALAAVWLGLREGYWRRQAQQDEAEIVMTVVRTELSRLLPLIRRIKDAVSYLSIEPGGYSDYGGAALQIKEVGGELRMYAIEQMLGRLQSLPSSQGNLVAELWATMPILERTCNAVRDAEHHGASSRSLLIVKEIQHDVRLVAHHARILLGGDRGHPWMERLDEEADLYERGALARL